jgi:hypothetical protein
VTHTSSTTTTTTILKKKNKTNPLTVQKDIRPSTLSFGLLKIIFNESDSTYSTRLAGLCNEKKTKQLRRRIRNKKGEVPRTIDRLDRMASTLPHATHYCSTEALVNEIQSSPINNERKLSFDQSEDVSHSIRASPRMQLLIQQHLSNENTRSEEKSNSTLNYFEPAVSIIYESSRAKTQLQRPKTAGVTRKQTSVNAVGAPSRLSSAKISPTFTYKKFRKINRSHSATLIPRHQPYSNLPSEATTYSQTLYNGRPLSAVLQSHCRHPPLVQRTIDSSCTIREAKGATSRYNKPEELFGLKPEELFGLTEHQPKLMNHQKIKDNARLKHQQYMWQQDVDRLVNLYTIHHSPNYRKTAVPPPQVIVQGDTIGDLPHMGKARGISLSKHPASISRTRSPTNPKQSTLASLNIPRRNSISQRPSIKLTNA